MDEREKRIRGWGKTYRASSSTIEGAVRSGTDADSFIRSILTRAPDVVTVKAASKAAPKRRAADAVPSREATIRRYAKAAGMPELGAEHIKAGTPADGFFEIAAGRLMAGGAITGTHTVKRTKSTEDFKTAIARGAREAERLRSSINLDFLDTYANGGRGADSKEDEDDDDDERDDDMVDDDDRDDDEDLKAKAEEDEADRRRGEREALRLTGKRVRQIPSRADIAEHRKVARKSVDARVDAVLDRENGRREAEKLLRRKSA